MLRVWVFLETTMTRGNDFVTAVCLAWVMMVVFCLRFAHLQMAQISEIASWYWELFVTRGKSRDSGTRRRPFKVRAPTCGVSGVDIAQIAHRVLYRVTQGKYVPNFMLFDTTPARAKLGDIQGFLSRKMSRPKFVGFSMQLFKSPTPGLTEEQARACATYWARRLFPWLAEAMNMNSPERLAIGDWRDFGPAVAC